MQILIINNHKAQANFIQQGLRYENFGSDICYSETEGLTNLLYQEYQAIIIKHAHPAIDGIQLSKQIQNLTPKIPIIILSDLNLPALQESAKILKNTVLLITPFSFHKLCEHLKELTAKYFSINKPNELKFDDLTLNLSSREVYRQDLKYFLRNKEFSLLELLILNQGKILSRNEILERVWDRNTNITTNTVDVHINNLRKKIDQGFDKKLIHTIHGIGYKLE